MEEDKTSNVNLNLSNKDVNINMGDGRTTIETSTIGTINIETTIVPPPPPSSPPATSMILPTSTFRVSPIFSKVMKEPVTNLFSSHSTESEQIIHEEENDDDVMVAFSDLAFNLKEDDVPSNAIMSGKQFKVLNSKLISILQFLNEWC